MKKSILIYLKEGLYIFILLLVIFSTIMQLSTPTGAVSVDDQFEYQELANGDYTISAFYGSNRVVEIPEQFQGRKIVGIEKEVFKDSNVYGIHLPSSVNLFGYHSLNTEGTLDIVVDNSDIEYYTNILDESILNDTVAYMIDGYNLFAVVNGKIVYESNYHYTSTSQSLLVVLQVEEKVAYHFEDGIWKHSFGSFLCAFDSEGLVWLYNGEIYTDEAYLDIEDISQMDGVFTAVQNGEELFKIDLGKSNTGNDTTQSTTIETGISPNTKVGLMAVGSVSVVLILLLLKAKRILNGK